METQTPATPPQKSNTLIDTSILVAIIGAFVTLSVFFIGEFYTRNREVRQKEIEFKLQKYNDFLGGFAEIGSGTKTYAAHLKFANAINTCNIIASKKTLGNMYALLDYVSTHNGSDYSIKEQDAIIQNIILSIREDLGQSSFEFQDFPFRTISPGGSPENKTEQGAAANP